jgi:glycosyltransferase involved in cell wall biosynthesis
MKICLIGNDYKQQLPLLGYGGIETAFENTCLSLKYFKNKITPCVFIPKRLQHKNKMYDFKIVETNYVESFISGIPPVHYAIEVKEIIKRANIKPDIIWTNGSWSVEPLSELNIPIICTIMDSGGWVDNRYIYNEKIYYRFVSKFLYDFVFKDAKTNDYINKIKSQSFWCYPGFSDEEFVLEENKEDYILWCAGLLWGLESKGLDLFIRMAKERPDQTFVAYGSYDERHINLVNSLKQTSKELNNFEYLGPLERGDKHKNVFKKAKLFTFLTQTTEAFGMTGVEAISKGTPVLGTMNGSLPEVYQNICTCTNNFNEMLTSLDKKHNYKDIFNYSLKFHAKNEINFLYEKSKNIIQ